jgi:murein DD-endopeptidase MepM/ murein hydrolase activator NlpD
MRRTALFFVLLILLLTPACTRAAVNAPVWTPVASVNMAMPTLPPVQTFLPPTRAPGEAILSPTPDVPVILPTFTPLSPLDMTFVETPTPGPLTHIVQEGEYPGSIAAAYGISLDELLNANNLSIYDVIYPGQELLIPGLTNQDAPTQAPVNAGVMASSDFFKVIPDSELVYGPLGTLLDVEAYVQQKSGYLAYYTQDVDGETLNGGQIVRRVAENYSVNPRLLLAVLEYRAQWVSNPNPAPSTYYSPIGYVDDFHQGLYRQLTWTADRLNEGFYRWHEGKVTNWTLADGTQVVPQPGINAGTAGVQNLFASFDDHSTWVIDTGPNGLFATYSAMFGYPFDFAIEPLIPSGLQIPGLTLPFGAGEIWQFTGGPHGGWDTGSAWAALDFAPPGEPLGCTQTSNWTTAIANGLIVRTGGGQVIQDLDGDGLEQTGWVILYMHIDSQDRVQPGQFIKVGDKIGRASCEGGFSTATHLHIARKFNGMWIAADNPSLPFNMDGWTPESDAAEYSGRLKRNGAVIESWDGINPINQIRK